MPHFEGLRKFVTHYVSPQNKCVKKAITRTANLVVPGSNSCQTVSVGEWLFPVTLRLVHEEYPSTGLGGRHRLKLVRIEVCPPPFVENSEGTPHPFANCLIKFLKKRDKYCR
jgi:hypothetical protein